jgi:hypothetical protein
VCTNKNHNIKIANRPFENVTQFKYLGTTVANKHFFHKEIRRFILGNGYCNSVQNLMSCSLPSKSIKIEI